MKRILLLLALAIAALQTYEHWPRTDRASHASSATAQQTKFSNEHLIDAFHARRSNIQVQGSGEVVRVLPDDRDGSRHQRIIVAVAPSHTVLIAHNIDLAPRVENPQAGRRIEFNGEYEWNERGGVVHWTHHDPQGRHEAGWVKYGGRLYQ
jgi:hypothetical protein